MIEEASLIAFTNWTMIIFDMWEHILNDILPHVKMDINAKSATPSELESFLV